MFSAKRLLNKIRAFRKDNRITQIAFAKQIGISVSTLVNWERERSDFNPTLTQIINMAKVFGVTPGELLLQGKDKLVAKDNGKDNSKTASKQAQSKTKSSTKAKAATVLEANEKKQSKRTAKSSSVAEVKGKASAAAVAMPDTSTKQERKRGRTRKHV